MQRVFRVFLRAQRFSLPPPVAPKSRACDLMDHCLPSCRWRRSSTRAKSAAGSRRPSRINSASCPGNSGARAAERLAQRTSLTDGVIVFFVFFSAHHHHQGADPPPETIQLQRAAVPEQQAGPAGGHPPVPDPPVPLHRSHQASS